MQKVPDFFDWRGELSRWNFFKGTLLRLVIYSLIVAFDLGLNYMFGWNFDFEKEDTLSIAMEEPLPTAAFLILFVPIEIRRASDAGLSAWLVFLVHALTLIPSPPASAEETTWGAYLLVILLPMFVVLDLRS